MLSKIRILEQKKKSGEIIRYQEQVLKEAANFYLELHSSPEQISDISTPSNTNDILPAILKEVSMGIKIMKYGKASEEHKLTVDILKETGNETIEVLTELFNKCVTLFNVPKDWKACYHHNLTF